MRAPAILRGIQKSGENVPKMSRGPFSDAARKMSRKCFENVGKMSGAQKKCPKNVGKMSKKCLGTFETHFETIFGTEKAFKGGARFARAPFGGF